MIYKARFDNSLLNRVIKTALISGHLNPASDEADTMVSRIIRDYVQEYLGKPDFKTTVALYSAFLVSDEYKAVERYFAKEGL